MPRYHLLGVRAAVPNASVYTSIHTWGTRNVFHELTWKILGSKEFFSVDDRRYYSISCIATMSMCSVSPFPFFLLYKLRAHRNVTQPCCHGMRSCTYVCSLLIFVFRKSDQSQILYCWCLVNTQTAGHQLSSLMDNPFWTEKKMDSEETRMLKRFKNAANNLALWLITVAQSVCWWYRCSNVGKERDDLQTWHKRKQDTAQLLDSQT